MGPLAWMMGTIAYFVCVAQLILSPAAQTSAVAALLALPPIAIELAFTRYFEVPARGWTRPVVAGVVARLCFLAMLAFLFVWLPLDAKGTPSVWFAQDLSEAPLFLRIVWFASPAPAVVLGLLCLTAYLAVTVRRRRARLTTTALLPGLATIVLFVLMYQFPDAGIRTLGRSRPDFVVRAWAPTAPEHRFPREVMVTPDEQHAVATFGSTFPVDSANPPPDELGLGPRCDPQGPNPAECRRNLALIDLDTGATRTWSMTMARRFFSETGDRFFVAPWNLSDLLELRLDGSVQKYALPQSTGDGNLREINHTYYAPDLGRVYMTSGNNPVVLVWDTDARELTHIVRLAGWNGINVGDSTLAMARSRSRRRLYVTVKSDPRMIAEVDEAGLEPLRTIRPPGDVYEIAVSPDDRSLYAASFLSGRIWRFDADTLALTATMEAPLQCRRLAFSPDGSQLFAASYVTGDVVVYDTRTNRRIESFYVGPRLEGMDVAGGGLYLLSAEGLFRVPLDVLKRRGDGAVTAMQAR